MSETKKTIVIEKTVKWGRGGYIEIFGDEVVFDTSDDEYGPVYFSLELLESKIKEHKEKMS